MFKDYRWTADSYSVQKQQHIFSVWRDNAGSPGPGGDFEKIAEKMQTALVAFTLKFIPHLPRHCGRRCVWERLFETIHPGKTVAPVAKHQWPVGPSEKQPVSFCINHHLWTTHGSIISCSCVCSGSLSRCFPYTCFTNYYLKNIMYPMYL